MALAEAVQVDGAILTALYPYLAESHNQLENYEQAYEFYQLAYTEQKEDVYFLEKYAYFLLEEGKRQQAKTVIQQLLSLQPDSLEWSTILDEL